LSIPGIVPFIAVLTTCVGIMTWWCARLARRARRAEEARAFLERIVDRIADPVFVKDRNHRLVVVNEAECRLAGRTRSELIGKTDYDFFPKEQVDVFWRQDDLVSESGRENVNEETVTDANGVPRTIVTKKTLYVDAIGQKYIVGVIRDITDRTRAEDALRLRAHVTHTPLAAIEWDAEYRVKSFSARAEKLFGWSADEVIGKRHDELPWVSDEDWPVVREVMRAMSLGERPTNVSANRNRRKDGSLIRCEWYNSALHDPAGKLVSVLSLVLDVTERERTAEALRTADRLKTEFLAVLSHELRNPLAPIRNSIQLLDRVPPGSEQMERAKGVIRRQTEHLTRIVDDLLDVTRISRGKIELQRAPVDLREVVGRTCDDHRTLFQGRRIELRVEASRPVWVDADATRIAQVLGNLLQNAAKFSREGGTVTTRVAAVDGHAEIRVRDEGVGIGPELLPRIFEPFFQADEGLARTRGGLGLGLALVKALVELHGGSVQAESAGAGRGSELVVTLPLAPGARPSVEAVEAPEPRRTVDILVIEDNVDAAESIAHLLELEGHRVHVATDGRSGIAKARELRPEVVLCDIGLPDVDGYEVARELRADAALRGTRLVALTGYTLPEDKERARQAGFEAHLGKPSSPDELRRLFRSETTPRDGSAAARESGAVASTSRTSTGTTFGR
jgi:two-component system CheB/CheR fusion protein